MRIFIDNDACPREIRELVFQSGERRAMAVVVVGNSFIKLPRLPNVTQLVVPGGFDAADDRIVEECVAGDLVITADVPLASRVVAKGAEALSPRGEVFDARSIQERLAMRNLLQEFRSAGEIKGGPGAFTPQDRKRFADALDRMTARGARKEPPQKP
jgi:uncharacterized protein YaiI (UPF0178 family)